MSDIIDYPVNEFVLPSTIRFSLVPNVLVSRSSFNNTSQTLELPGAYWSGQLSFSDLLPEEYRPIISFFNYMRGEWGRFRMPILDHMAPAGNVDLNSTITIKEIIKKDEIVLTGFTPNTSKVLKAYDYIGIRDRRVYQVVFDTNSDSEGDAIVNLSHPLFESDLLDEEVSLDKPRFVAKRTDSRNINPRVVGRRKLATFSINFEEAF